jgi:hypothetical protein
LYQAEKKERKRREVLGSPQDSAAFSLSMMGRVACDHLPISNLADNLRALTRSARSRQKSVHAEQ